MSEPQIDPRPVRYRVRAGGAHVRAAPALSSPPLATLAAGEEVTGLRLVLGQLVTLQTDDPETAGDERGTHSRAWRQVILASGQRGYIWSRRLEEV